MLRGVGLRSFCACPTPPSEGAERIEACQVTSWSPSANNVVKALAVTGGRVFAGGKFTSVSGFNRNYVAPMDAVTGNVATWSPHASSWVNALAARGTTLYVGGVFDNIAGKSRSHLATLDVLSGAAMVRLVDQDRAAGRHEVAWARSGSASACVQAAGWSLK